MSKVIQALEEELAVLDASIALAKKQAESRSARVKRAERVTAVPKKHSFEVHTVYKGVTRKVPVVAVTANARQYATALYKETNCVVRAKERAVVA